MHYTAPFSHQQKTGGGKVVCFRAQGWASVGKRGGLVGGRADGGEEAAEAGGQLVLPVGLGLLQGRGEGVTERPDRPGLELVVLRLEVVRVDGAEQADGELALGEGAVDERLSRGDGQDLLPHVVHPLPERFPTPLEPVNADGERVYEVEVAGVFGGQWLEVAAHRHVVADEDPVARRHGERHALVVRVAERDGEPDPLVVGVDFEEREQPRAVLGDGVVTPHDADVTEAEGFFELVDDLGVRDDLVRVSGRGRWECREFFPRHPARSRVNH